MSIRRTAKPAPDAGAYTAADAETDPWAVAPEEPEEPTFEPEDPDEVPVNAGIIQSGWGAAQKKLASSSTSITSDFKVTGENQLVRFLVDQPHFFMQHWIERQGKKSFICLGGPATCPLCKAGDKPSLKYAFQVVNLSSDEDNIVPQWWIAGTRVFQQLSKFQMDPKTGPLDRGYYSVSKSGTGNATVHTIIPVKERDLEEEWDIEISEVKKLLSSLEPLDEATLRPSSVQELREIAKEL